MDGATEGSRVERAIRISPRSFLTPASEEPVRLSAAQQTALRDGTWKGSDGGRALSGYVRVDTKTALRRLELVTPFAYALTPLGLEIYEVLHREGSTDA